MLMTNFPLESRHNSPYPGGGGSGGPGGGGPAIMPGGGGMPGGGIMPGGGGGPGGGGVNMPLVPGTTTPGIPAPTVGGHPGGGMDRFCPDAHACICSLMGADSIIIFSWAFMSSLPEVAGFWS